MQPFVAKVVGIRDGTKLTCVKQGYVAEIKCFEDAPFDESYTIAVLNLREGGTLELGGLVIVHAMPKTYSLEDIRSGKAAKDPVLYVCYA